ncbi:unnamed protein product, partial [Effrenium voratum]
DTRNCLSLWSRRQMRWADVTDQDGVELTWCWTTEEYVRRRCALTLSTPVGWVRVDKEAIAPSDSTAKARPKKKDKRAAAPSFSNDSWDEEMEAEISRLIAENAAVSSEAGCWLDMGGGDELARCLERRVRRERRK